jgi:hypothetical protein
LRIAEEHKQFGPEAAMWRTDETTVLIEAGSPTIALGGSSFAVLCNTYDHIVIE